MKMGNQPAGLKELATALAAIDGRGSAAAVLDVIATPGQWDQYTCLAAAERLLMAGVVLPATTAFALADSILERTEEWMQDSDKYPLRRILELCPFVDDPAAGIAKVCDVLRKRRLRGYELCGLVIALGESRSDTAIDLLYELASDAQTFEQCEDSFINASPRSIRRVHANCSWVLSIRTSAASRCRAVLTARMCWSRGSRNWPSVGRRRPLGCSNCANATYRNSIDTSFRASWAGSERPKVLLQI